MINSNIILKNKAYFRNNVFIFDKILYFDKHLQIYYMMLKYVKNMIIYYRVSSVDDCLSELLGIKIFHVRTIEVLLPTTKHI